MSDYDLPIRAMDRRRHRRAVAELVNQERRKRGLRRLRHSPRLSLSARAWARALTAGSRFTHGDFARRVLRFPFVLASRGKRWRVAENLAWGSGPESTPRRIVASWMASPEHRENILGSWQYGAVWTQQDAPKPGVQRDSVTVVQHFGSRR
ncbi:MAG: hypothetical protein QOG77_1760 [Solirubrobacteraceae bacterium]|nr:hypothetical protein [Solirubrobacteraceae bacterium]